eukprot:224082_1
MAEGTWKSWYTWIITDPSMLQKIKNAECGESFQTDYFEIHPLPVKWRIKLYSNGLNKNNKGNLQLYVDIKLLLQRLSHITVSFELLFHQVMQSWTPSNLIFDGGGGHGSYCMSYFQDIQKFDKLSFRFYVRNYCIYGKDGNDITHEWTNKKQINNQKYSASIYKHNQQQVNPFLQMHSQIPRAALVQQQQQTNQQHNKYKYNEQPSQPRSIQQMVQSKNNHSNEEQKCNNFDALKQKHEIFKQKYETVNQQNESLIKEKNKIMQEKQVVLMQMKELQLKYDQVNQNNKKLNEEYKELHYELQQIKKTLRKSKINEKSFVKWDYDQIADWIVSLDSEHEVYEKVLKENLKKEGVDGSLLPELERNDLHRFGIVRLKHKISIMKHIKRVSAQQKAQFVPNNEGNNVAPTAYI